MTIRFIDYIDRIKINTNNPTNDFFNKDQIEGVNFASAINNITTFSDDMTIKQKINESLIVSYDVQKLIDMLFKEFKNRIAIGDERLPNIISVDYFKTKYKYVFGFALGLLNYNEKIDKPKLLKLLNFFGYHIIDTRDINNGYTALTIEPKVPVVINDMLNPFKVKFLYHITLTKNIDKINKIGLIPKESKTSFTHSGNRIYLLFARDERYAISLAKLIASDRGHNVREYTIIKTKYIPSKYQYYMDSACMSKSTELEDFYIGCFVTKNIPPTEFIDEIDLGMVNF